MHIIFLHGYGQDANLMEKSRCDTIAKSFRKQGYECHFLNGPETVPRIGNNAKQSLGWWQITDKDDIINSSVPIDKELIDEIMWEIDRRTNKEPCIIFGFSQGACLGSILIDWFPNRFLAGILIANFPVPWHEFSKEQKVPILSVNGKEDFLTKNQWKRIQKRYSEDHHQFWVHPKGHMIPKNVEAREIYNSFLKNI